MAEAKLKQISGGDKITARFLFKEFFEFRPQFKIWLASNHRPVILGTDRGIWCRIRLIPFTVEFSEDKQDKELKDKLLAELPGILNWALQGLADYQKNGMQEPQTVLTTTSEYQHSQDWLARFLDDLTVPDPNGRVGARELYRKYEQWCKDSGERPSTEAKFAQAMQDRGFKSKKVKEEGRTPRM